jgi:hypothetical protein
MCKEIFGWRAILKKEEDKMLIKKRGPLGQY